MPGKLWPLLAAFALLFACRQVPQNEVVAWVNDQPIYLSDFKDQLEKNWIGKEAGIGNLDYRLKLKCLEDIIKQRLILKEADRLGITISEQELNSEMNKIIDVQSPQFQQSLEESGISIQKWKEQLKNDLLLRKTTDTVLKYQYQVGEDEIKSYFEKHQADFVTPVQYQVRQILVTNEDKAKEILARLNAGAEFENLAREYSQSPEASQGGDLGWLEPDQLPASLHSEIIKLGQNQTSGLVKSPYGFHILKLQNIKQSERLSYEAAKPQILKLIEEQKKNELYQQWLQQLWKKSRIKVNYQVL